MVYNDIQDKEMKVVLCLLDILQNTKELAMDEKDVFDILKKTFYVDGIEKSTIYHYAQSKKWITAPDGFKNNRGGKDYFPIDSKCIHNYIEITSEGHNELLQLLPLAKNWVLNKEQSEYIANLKKQLLESQIDSIEFAKQTTKETIEIAKSAKIAAWASAFGAIVTALLALIPLIKAS